MYVTPSNDNDSYECIILPSLHVLVPYTQEQCIWWLLTVLISPICQGDISERPDQ
jgi:hypothetical protein